MAGKHTSTLGDVYRSLAKADHTDAWQMPDGTLASADRHFTVLEVDGRYATGVSWWSAEPDRTRRTRVQLCTLQSAVWRYLPDVHKTASYGGLGAALKATHPDTGGNPEAFHRVDEARRIIEEANNG